MKFTEKRKNNQTSTNKKHKFKESIPIAHNEK